MADDATSSLSVEDAQHFSSGTTIVTSVSQPY
jgi:hypothetical protein